MANAPRTRLDPEARRSQLVELGLRMLSTRPLDKVAIDDIAAEAGISRGLLFHYFPTKRDFHVAVAQAAAQELLDRTDPDPDLPLIGRLRAGVEAFVDHVTDNRDAYVAFIRGSSGGDPQPGSLHACVGSCSDQPRAKCHRRCCYEDGGDRCRYGGRRA